LRTHNIGGLMAIIVDVRVNLHYFS